MIRSHSSSPFATGSEQCATEWLARTAKHGIALVTVLYFLVVVGLLAGALIVASRATGLAGDRIESEAQLVAAAESAIYGELANWDAPGRSRQATGTTITHTPAAPPNVRRITVYVTRLSSRLYSLVADAMATAGVVRRVNLLVRVPLPDPLLRTALVSAGDVTLGPGARVIVADSVGCGATQPAAVTLAPGAQLLTEDSLPTDAKPLVNVSAVAADSLTYSRVAGASWDDLVSRADVHLPAGAHATPAPVIEDGRCTESAANWGEPRHTASPSPCEGRVPLVHAGGDLTIDGGRAQGVLLVDGRLRIVGPFLFSGHIVARGGVATLSDGIDISGIVMSAARTPDDLPGGESAVSLRHQTTLRYSVCDAQHGVASWLEPRVVRQRGWAELF